MSRGAGFFGNQSWAVHQISLESQDAVPADDFNPIPALLKICETAGMNAHSKLSGKIPGNIQAHLEQPGCSVEFQNFVVHPSQGNKPQTTKESEPLKRLFRIECNFSPDLYALNAKPFDQWLEEVNFAKPLSVIVEFGEGVISERQRERLTSKLYHSGVRLLGDDEYEFEGFRFQFHHRFKWGIQFLLGRKLLDERLPRLIESLFRSLVFWEHEPDLSEMI